MKYAFLILAFLPAIVLSQKANKNDVPTTSLDSIVYDLTPKTLAPSGISLPFKSIKILDARFDTSKLGYEIHREYDYMSSRDFKKIKLAQGIARSMELFYNDYYGRGLKDTINELFIVVKTLWINNAPMNYHYGGTSNEMELESYQNINVKWEYYIKRNNRYYPFKRVDTLYQLTEPILTSRDHKFKKNDLSFFTFLLVSQLEQIDFENINKFYENKNGLTFHKIDSFNRTRFKLPVIQTNEIKKGIFRDFKEFKENTPGVESFEFKKIKKEKYWIDLKTTDIISKIFFVSDSIGLHIGAEKRISVLRVGNTFEFFYGGDIAVANSFIGNLLNIGAGAVYHANGNGQRRFHSGNGSNTQFILIPRQINMETGEVY